MQSRAAGALFVFSTAALDGRADTLAQDYMALTCHKSGVPDRRGATTDSDHDGPIIPNLVKDVLPTGPNELWVADITYIAISLVTSIGRTLEVGCLGEESAASLAGMVAFLSILLAATAGMLSIPVFVFALQVFAGIFGKGKPARLPVGRRPQLAVLVPAHNEGPGLLLTMHNLMRQLEPGDRLLVVADNCDDDTARVAASAGADVVERYDPERPGKGYALDFGIRHLSRDPPEVLIVIDADCRVAAGTIDALTRTCAASGRPVQALYLMSAPPGSSINHQVAEFAWRVKNHLRPLGLQALGLPCQLMGSGMAFPWGVLSSVNLADAEVVEDLKLGLDLAAAGKPPLFLPQGLVSSHFPHTTSGAATQRRRWEHGHIAMIRRSAPRLVLVALRQGNLPLLALALDLAVPPVALLALLVWAMVAVTALAALVGLSAFPLLITLVALGTFTAAAVVAWRACGRDVLPAGSLPLIAGYVARKAGSYPGAVLRRSRLEWTRTERKRKA